MGCLPLAEWNVRLQVVGRRSGSYTEISVDKIATRQKGTAWICWSRSLASLTNVENVLLMAIRRILSRMMTGVVISYCLGLGDKGSIFHTSNGGRNWSTLSFLGTNKPMVHRTARNLNGLSLSGGNILLVGDGGIILGREGPDIPVAVEYADERAIPVSMELNQNYPNPFNAATMISYQLPLAGDVRLSIFDILGRELNVLVDERKPAGVYRISWNAGRLSSGMYLSRLSAGGYILTRKLLLIK